MIGKAWAADAAHGHGPFYAEPEFWVAVAFVIFIAVFGRAIWRQIAAGLDARTAGIAKALQEAEALREQAQELLNDYQRKQRAAAGEAQGIILQAREEAARMRQRAREELETSIKLRERQAMDRIAQAEAKALADVRNAAVDLAIGATHQVLREQVGTSAAQAAMIDQSLTELPRRMN